jgi:hypothetical protein
MIMEDKNNVLLIDDIKYEIPEMIIKTINQTDFDKLNDSETSLEMRYLILKKLDYVTSNHVGLLVDPDIFKGRGSELSGYVNMADFFANKKEFDKSNNLLLKSIKVHMDVYNEAKEMDINK